MPVDRRYSPEEIASIFQDAANAQEASGRGPHVSGLTLAEIQTIGAEEGLDPTFVARAAARLDAPRLRPTRVLGVPSSAEHRVLLPAPLLDADWERLVARFRQTFDAHGTTRVDGNVRTWRNGNLRITTETGAGGPAHLHFRTRNRQMEGGLAGGSLIAGVALVLLLATSLIAGSAPPLIGFGLLLLLGLVMAGVSALNLPAWREERLLQFEVLAEQAASLAAERTASGNAAPTPIVDLDALPDLPGTQADSAGRVRE